MPKGGNRFDHTEKTLNRIAKIRMPKEAKRRTIHSKAMALGSFGSRVELVSLTRANNIGKIATAIAFEMAPRITLWRQIYETSNN